MRGRDRVLRYRSALGALERSASLLTPEQAAGALRAGRRSSGLTARALRYALLGRAASHRGDLVDVREDVYLHGVAGLRLGSRVSIHPLTYIDATGGLQVGDDVSIAHGATIMTTTHTWSNPDLPIRDNPVVPSSVTIGSNVWVGAGARILAGSHIGDGCVIGAGAVVTGVIPPNSVAVGVPARVVKPVYPSRRDQQGSPPRPRAACS